MAAGSEARDEGRTWSAREALRALSAGSIGNFVEWYDFAIYSYSVPIIATVFFPEGDRTAAILSAFALYGVAFLARPLGGVFWGNLGDKVGRRNTLAAIVLLMGGATMLIGLLPSYAQVGLLAPILLALLRLIQGFSGGGEFTGSTSFITEYAPDNRRGLFASTSATFTTLPSILGGLTVLAVTATLSSDAYSSWGWRIPFLIGGPLALVGLYIRLKMQETPAFRTVKRTEHVESVPVLEAIRHHWRNIMLIFAIASLSALGAYTLGAYFVTYLVETIGLDMSTAILANFAAFFVTVPLVPLVGMLGDRIGRKPLLFIGSVAFIVLSVPGFMIAGSGGRRGYPGAVAGGPVVELRRLGRSRHAGGDIPYEGALQRCLGRLQPRLHDLRRERPSGVDLPRIADGQQHHSRDLPHRGGRGRVLRRLRAAGNPRAFLAPRGRRTA